MSVGSLVSPGYLGLAFITRCLYDTLSLEIPEHKFSLNSFIPSGAGSPWSVHGSANSIFHFFP